MTFKQLTIFVEGEYDEIFFDQIVKKMLERTNTYDNISVFKWCRKEKELIKNFVQSLNDMNSAESQYDYIFVTDFDPPNIKCVSQRKEIVCGKFCTILPEKIIVVINEIEGWYLAGISEKNRKKLGINSEKFHSIDPNTVVKEIFEIHIKPKKKSKLEFMLDVVKVFDVYTARKRNDSFNYFFEHYLESSKN
jgi:hypothetical protein